MKKKEEILFLPAWTSACGAVMPWPLACVGRPVLLCSVRPVFGCCRLPGSLTTHPREDPEGPLVYNGMCECVYSSRYHGGILDASRTGYINAERLFLMSSRRRLFFHRWQDTFLRGSFQDPSELRAPVLKKKNRFYAAELWHTEQDYGSSLSFSTNNDQFKQLNGVNFTFTSMVIFDHFWKHYPDPGGIRSCQSSQHSAWSIKATVG